MLKEGMFCLIKFGQKQYMENLLKKGEVCFNPIDEFRTSIEKERGDSNEGAISLQNVKVKEIKAEHPDLGTYVFKPAPNSVFRLMNFDDAGYLSFSSYAITLKTFQKNNEHKISEKMLEFGEYAIVVKEPLKFINCILENLKDKNVLFKEGMIEYLNLSIEEKYDLSFFNKSEDFKHQEEYRIIFQSLNSERCLIYIGSIEEYAVIVKTEDLIKNKWSIVNKERNPR